MTGVFTRDARFRAALAELPLTAGPADEVFDAVVVVPGGGGWVEAATATAAAGAAALVVAHPAFVPADALRRLARDVGIPVVVERALLRPDVADDAAAGRSGSAPRMLIADGAASAAQVPVVAREAVGWLRALAAAEVRMVATAGHLAMLETDAGVPATLSVVATSRAGGGWIHVQALGEVSSDVEVEKDAAQVVTATAAGRLIAPPRFESSARLALRRAIAAAGIGADVDDLRRLAEDTELVERMRATAP
jgi:hypothetical protein